MLEFCGNKGIKQEYSNARTPQQNGVAERMNKTLIEAARTMLGRFSLYQQLFGRSNKPNVKGVGYRWMFDIDYLSDSMNYIPVSLENQANPHAGASEVTNSAGTPKSIASEEKDEEVELIVVPTAVKIPDRNDESRTYFHNSKTEETLNRHQKERRIPLDSLEEHSLRSSF
ncbi:putative ribonuclease H-like domain-containing protein [Tanacetum coccineum]